MEIPRTDKDEEPSYLIVGEVLGVRIAERVRYLHTRTHGTPALQHSGTPALRHSHSGTRTALALTLALTLAPHTFTPHHGRMILVTSS
eukprot:COSAG06_NODE_6753_length_2797_cov_2.323202_4_plen_88_part_00